MSCILKKPVTEESTEESFLLETLHFNNKRYSNGLFNKEGLFVKEEWIRSVIKTEDSIRDIEFNIKTKEVKVADGEERSIISEDNNNDIECYSIVDLNEDGIRWEGIVVNGTPFGYGSLYTNSNELIYRGVMIGDKKECFGIDFYPVINQIEYIGCYYNNEKHGFGMLYDRKGKLLYEGDWLYGSNDIDVNMKLKVIGDERMVHSLIHELVIDEGVSNDYKDDLLLCGFANLERLVVKKNSFQNLNCLTIADNCVLKSIEIEYGRWKEGAFMNASNVTLSSNLIYE